MPLTVDADAEHRSQDALGVLTAASAVLGQSLDLREAARAIAYATVPHCADWAIVDALDEEGRLARLAHASADPARVAAAEAIDRRWPPDFERLAATHAVLATGAPLLMSDVRDEDFAALAHDAEQIAAWRAFRVRSCVAVPLEAAGERLGVLTLFTVEGGHRYTDADVALAVELGRRSANSLLYARLFARERRAHAETESARDRTERLQRLSAELTRSLTPDAVVDVVVRHLVTALGANAAGVFELSADGREFRLLGSAGVDDAHRPRFERVPADTALPIGGLLRSRVPVLIGDSRAWLAEHADVALLPGDDARAWAALPLRSDDGPDARLLGALTVTMPGPRVFSDDDRGFLQAFADLCAQALERARLYAAERRARERAEALQALASALTRAVTAEEVADVVVTRGMTATGTGCAVLSLLDADARTFTIVAAPDVPADLVTTWRRFPNVGEHPATVAARTGRPCYSRTRAEYAARGPGLDRIAEEMGVGAEATLPLIVEGRVIGVLSLAFSAPREFDAEEDAHLRTLADLCGPAFERARLYEAERARVAAEAARAEAEAASRAKDELLAVVSHELRAPLAPARALAQVLARAAALAPEHREMANEIDRHIAYEARLIGDLLNYERATRGMLALKSQRCDVHEIAHRALHLATMAFRTREASVDLDFAAEEAVVWADPTRVKEILYNLLVNAIKFSPLSAPIVVRTRTPVPGWIEVLVVDAGVGIDPEQLPRLFEPFTRLHAFAASSARRTYTSGLGLGLALSRRLAEAQGGTLTAASAGRGAGATFTLRLPTVPASILAEGGAGVARISGATRIVAAPPAGDSAPERGLRVLVLENDAAAARALRRLLATDGHTVFVAGDLAAAERIAAAEPLDVLLCDLHLGAETGLDAPRRVAEAVRRRAGAPPPAVVLSGFDRASDVADSRAAGFVAHLAKPVEEEVLFQTLRRVVSGAAQ